LADLRKLPRTWAEKIQQVNICGTPDILACVNGVFVAIELKRDRNAVVEQIQKYTLDKISGANGRSYIVHPDNWRRVHAELAQLALAAA